MKHPLNASHPSERGYDFDEERGEWFLWREFGEHATLVFITQDGVIQWAVYGPEERFGFFSLLATNKMAERNLERAEVHAKNAMVRMMDPELRAVLDFD